MNEDIVPELLEAIVRDFEQALESSQVVNECLTALAAKEATYETANAYAIEIGRILSEALGASITSQNLPDGKMYYNIAKRVLEDRLGANHELVVNFSSSVQQLLNENAGIGLKIQVPDVNQDRIDGFVNRLSSEEQFDDVAWILREPIVNFTQSIVDDSIRKNAEFQNEAGLQPEVIRTESGNCCDWCREVVGVYKYPRVPKDVWRRHQRCRCTTIYDPKSGKIRDVWSKIWRKKEARQEAAERVSKAIFSEGVMSIRKDIAKLDMTRAKPSDIIELGKRVNYHFKVSEHIGDKEKLKEIFSHFREIGGEVPKASWAKGSTTAIKNQLNEAFSYYPKEWSEIPLVNNKQLNARKGSRGFFAEGAISGSRRWVTSLPNFQTDYLTIVTDGFRKTTPYHEIGHLVEWNNPDLVRIEKEWVDSRTVGEKSTKLKSIFPKMNYRPSEVTKKDHFVSPYIGK